ncbi:nucleotidyltransferase domain-containing protein [Priestia megaterium]|uniref:nucleotidyltransferase domain-containing protein n=1 Tax=Priestia megaterium TaxID=1404 RepID=UPI00244B8ECA|nr:nucleotidyltransferase family protein [Priestia megaterium]MDH2363756.1 nucleotidyltransferase family protein [Priestia megaterium]
MHTKFNLDEKLLSKELKLLLELMKTENTNKIDLDKCDLFKNINWDDFLELAKYHRIYPLIYVKLKDLNEELVPKQVIAALYESYRHNTFQMLQLSGEMESINRLFNNNHIKVLFLKGPIIANDLYGDISLRTSKDLDLLIAKEDLDKANEILLQMGYTREKTSTILNEKKWRKHHVIYFHPKKKTEIEIHWRLHPQPSNEPNFKELWERKRESSFNFSSIYFLGEEDLFLFLVVHGARHGWFRLRWLKDIDQIMRHDIDLQKLKILIKKYQYSHLVGQALILVSTLLDTPLQKELETLMKKKQSINLARKAYSFISGFEEFTYHSRYLISLNLGLKKFLYIFILLYPDSKDLNTLALPKILHFLYFPLKPFLLIWRKIKKL